MLDDRPKLRPLDILPVQVHGQQCFLLRDPQRLSSQEIIVPADLAYLLSQFDGTHTVREAQVNYVRRFGSLLTGERIAELLRRLDEALFLDSDRLREFKAKIEAEFRASPTRPAAHAGQSYEQGAAAFVRTWEPRLASAGPPGDFALDARRPAFIAPHYSMEAAAECYAAAYAALLQAGRPDVAIILGIAHSSGDSPFVLTRKPFETPFGALETDERIIAQLAAAAPFDLFADEFLHRDEHSIEFQAVLVHLLYHQESDPPKIVPMLCGNYHRHVGQACAETSRSERAPAPRGELSDPREVPAVESFLSALQDIVAADPRRIALVASADLSHIGARFGQPPPLSQAHLDLARRHDMALLEKAQSGDAHGLYQVLVEEQDRYNVCGFPAIYALLRALPIKEGRLLSYQQAAEPQTHSCVSFASVGLR